MEIDATSLATKYIQRRGGRVYVWFKAVGKTDWMTQVVGFVEPPGIEFTEHPGQGFDVFLQADFEPPDTLRIARRPWPIGPIEVLGTGVGSAYGGGGEGGGGWPSGHGGGDGGGGGHGGHLGL